MVNIWWVNQNGKNERTVPTTVMWAPTQSQNNAHYYYWDDMAKAQEGDLVLHCAPWGICAISTVSTPAQKRDADEFPDYSGPSPTLWSLNVTDMQLLDKAIAYSELPLSVKAKASQHGEPFSKDGTRRKDGYFFAVSKDLWNAIKNCCPTSFNEPSQDKEVAELGITGNTDVRRIISARREQHLLRQQLLDSPGKPICGICGREMPQNYLHVAHIKRRESATEEERKDPNIVMWACVLGCDEAFEHGDIRIDDQGIISLHNPNSNFMSNTFGGLIGKKAPAFNDHNKQYFAARNASFR